MNNAALELANIAAYDRWAERYPPEAHNPLMRAEQAAMLARCPDATGRRVLDLACGTGRYGRLMQDCGALWVVGADSAPQMLRHSVLPWRLQADMAALPFADGQFDLILCGLAVGHAPSLTPWVREAARVLAPGGTLLISDFHPDAARAGMHRSFTDADGQEHRLAHGLHNPADHARAATDCGLVLSHCESLRVGHEFTEQFSGSDAFYARWQGLPLLLIVRMDKP
ncbi:class I SAM-dependent methyltransferase [Burkholderiaceae bacterium UC74_6]